MLEAAKEMYPAGFDALTQKSMSNLHTSTIYRLLHDHADKSIEFVFDGQVGLERAAFSKKAQVAVLLTTPRHVKHCVGRLSWKLFSLKRMCPYVSLQAAKCAPLIVRLLQRGEAAG